MDLERIQQELRRADLDGWLFYDFRGSDPLGRRVLGLRPDLHTTRRWFCLVPAVGNPFRIVHRIERWALDGVPGSLIVYLTWRELHEALRVALQGMRRLALQYSPSAAIPYVSRVDAGTVELIRTLAPEVELVSSADLLQQFEATCSPEQYRSHCEAAQLLGILVQETFRELARRVEERGAVTEWEMQQFVLGWYRVHGMVTDHPPIVACGPNTADPHYWPTPERHAWIRPGDYVLLDVWARLDGPETIYADITWVAVVAESVPDEVAHLFDVVARARDEVVAFLKERMRRGEPVRGFEADDVARRVLREAGLAEFFIHRTGHSIHTSTHGNGANLDNLETRDERLLLPGTCFSVEPGVYLEGKWGVRSEINVFLHPNDAEVTGPEPQRQVLTLLPS
jgi:Xaa-Pro dipeptidase